MKIITIVILFAAGIITAQDSTPPQPPKNVKVISYELHFDVVWDNNAETDLAGYKVYKNVNSNYKLVGSVKKNKSFFVDWAGSTDIQNKYKVTAFDNSGNESVMSDEASGRTHQMNDDEFLDMTQRAVFRYFWDWGDPNSGLARERWHPDETDVTNTIGGAGFGVMAIPVGIERGFITRQQGIERMKKILDFLNNKAEKFHGVLPHWINGSTGKVVKFGPYQDGGDIVESAFMIQGLLAVRQYFSNQNSDEELIRNSINQLWHGVDWEFYRNGSTGLYWNWSPTYGFNIPNNNSFIFHGWNETQIAYILAIASPTNSIKVDPKTFYKSGWGNGDKIRNTKTYYGYPLYLGSNHGGPLFFTHYSYLGFDPRGKRDLYANYFNQNRNQTLVQRAYSIANPKKFAGYNENCWGLTASYSIPEVGYSAHDPDNDNGTISPTAALSAMPYAPNESIAALKYFYRTYGDKLWGVFGFKDAFNISKNWFSDGYLAIDQGPIICMIENYRSQLLWNNFMTSPEIAPILDYSNQKGLFFPDPTDINEEKIPTEFKLNQNYPNPFNPDTIISYQLSSSVPVSLKVYDLLGREIATLVDEIQNSGMYNVKFNNDDFDYPSLDSFNRHGLANSSMSSGVYLYTLQAGNYSQTKKMILLR
jgi:hypothetical protein